MSETAEKMYTVPELSRVIGFAPRTIHRWIKTGLIKAVRIGPKCYRISVSEVEKLTGKDTKQGEKSS